MTLGIRPRAFDLASEPEADTITADADLIEPMGAETLVPGGESKTRKALNEFIRTSGLFDGVVDFDKATLDRETGELKAEFVPESTTGGPGDRLHLRAKLGQVHLFGEDERRIGT